MKFETQLKLLRLIKSLINRAGYEVVQFVPGREGFPGDLDMPVVEIIRRVFPETMTSPERLDASIRAVEHVICQNIPGAIVECGVWRGGSCMAMALSALRFGDEGLRDIYLFDTFEGMPPATEHDVSSRGGEASKDRVAGPGTLAASLELVQGNMRTTGYPEHRLHFIKGRVEEHVPARAPEQIAVLRLDTDWYESTKHELEQLWPRLSPGGICIIDDYGLWKGSRKATDEYLCTLSPAPFLSRIDHTARLLVKSA